MALGINVTVRNAMLNAIRDAADAGAGAAVVKIYVAPRPATGGAATTLLGTVACSDPCAPDAASGVLTFGAFTEDPSADTDGTAAWARLETSTGGFVTDMSVGEAGSGADLIMNTTTIVTGGPIRIDSGTITAGNA